MNKFTLILILIVATGMTACNNNGQAEVVVQPTKIPTEVSSFLMTSTPLPATSTPTRIPPLPAPTDVDLDSLLPDLRSGQYSLTIAGAINTGLGFTPQAGVTPIVYQPATGGTNTDGPYQLTMWMDLLTDGTTEDNTVQATFIIPGNLDAGTYDVVAMDTLTSADQIGVEVDTGTGTQRFATQAVGQMTIVANGGIKGVFSGEFNLTLSDDSGQTIVVSGRASGISFTALPYAQLTLTGAITLNPTLDDLYFNLAPDQSTSANDDWRMDVSIVSSDSNPYIIQHLIYMIPNISAGTYEIKPRNSPLDARPANVDVTAYVEILNVNDGVQTEITDVNGTLVVEPLRNAFTATFTLNYTTPDGQVTATGGGYYLTRPET